MQKITNYCDKCGATMDKFAEMSIYFHEHVSISMMAQSSAEWQSSCSGANLLKADLCPQCAAEIAGLFFDDPSTVTVN